MIDEERAYELLWFMDDGDLRQKVNSELLSAFTHIRNEAIAKERERAHTLLTELSGDRGQLLLASGEMSAQELRTAGAVLRYGAHMIKRTGEHADAKKDTNHEACFHGVAEEREACAKIAEGLGLETPNGGEIWIASRIASAIRSRTDAEKDSNHE